MKFGAVIFVFSLSVYNANAATGYKNMDLDNGNFKVMWKYDKVAGNLTFHLEVKANGWVGFGFAKTKAPNGMQDYDVIVGGVNGGAQYFNDYYTSGTQEPPKDASQDYTLLNASESGQWTRLSFTRKADTSDDKDVQLMAGKKVFLVYAYKRTVDVGAGGIDKHDETGNSQAEVELIPVQDASPTPTTMMSSPTPTTMMAYMNTLSFDNGNFKAYWNYDKAMEEYSFYLKVKTTGWVGFGFAKETSNSMKGYDVAIGGVGANGTAYINDFYTMGHVKPPSDSQQDFTSVKGQESGGYTEIWFKRKADTQDTEKDLKLTPGNQVFIVWAYHSDMDAEEPADFRKHSERGFSTSKMDLTKKMNGGGSLVTWSLGIIIGNLFIAMRCLL